MSRKLKTSFTKFLIYPYMYMYMKSGCMFIDFPQLMTIFSSLKMKFPWFQRVLWAPCALTKFVNLTKTAFRWSNINSCTSPTCKIGHNLFLLIKAKNYFKGWHMETTHFLSKDLVLVCTDCTDTNTGVYSPNILYNLPLWFSKYYGDQTVLA